MSVDEQLDASLARAEEALNTRSVDDLRMAQASLTGMLDLHARKDPHTEKLFRDVLRTVTEELQAQQDEGPGMRSNGRGIYQGTGLHKNDMVMQRDHRGRWRIDLITSTGGTHTDVTGPNRGYDSAEQAFTAALDEQRRRGLYGKTNVFVPDGDEYKLYEPEGAHLPFERNGRATTVDPVAARELDLYIANTYELVGSPNSIGKSIDANLKRKLQKGTYDSALAPKAWQHLVDEGAKRYEREFGSDSPIFNAATRRQVAADFARAWEDEHGLRRNGSTTTAKPLRFSTERAAQDWLRETGNVGRVHPSGRDYIIVQFADGATWAFTSAEETVILPDW